MNIQRFIAGAFSLGLLGCGGPVPSDVFLTLSVSTLDAAVETSINGKANEFLSGGISGSMTSSGPLNRLVREGENSATFVLTAASPDSDRAPEPQFLATLEIAMKGEMVDTLSPGERTMFSRELTEDETAALIAGETVTITETFTVDPARLQAIKDGGVN